MTEEHLLALLGAAEAKKDDRTFTLPEGVNPDQIRAELKEGVLHLTVPKTPEAQPRRVALQSGGKAKA